MAIVKKKLVKKTKKAPKKAVKKKTSGTAHRKVAKSAASRKSAAKAAPHAHRKPLKTLKTHTAASVFSGGITRSPHKKKARPWLHLESSRRTAYYGMGTMALVGGLTFLIAQSLREPSPSSVGATLKADSSVFEYVPEKTIEVTEAPASMPSGRGDLSEPGLAPEFREAKDLQFEKRMAFWSEFIEKKQANRDRVAELAQGHQIDDTAPIVPSAYDCTTFVETVAALARSEKPEDFFDHLMAIRYKNGQATYMTRNHFPEADWIPNNQRSEILTDITSKIAESGGITARVETKTIDRSQWLRTQMAKNKTLRSIASTQTDWPSTIDAQISYISVKEIEKVLSDIPNGTIVNLVHKNDSEHPVLITHQGIIIRNGNEVLMRHATRSGKIRTSNFPDYIKKLSKNAHAPANWPLIGVNFNRFNGNRDSKTYKGFEESKASSSTKSRRKASI